MFDAKRVKIIIKIALILISCILVIKVFTLTLSKYQSLSESQANLDVAFYVLNENYQTMALNLASIFPRSAPYLYTFSVSNSNRTKQSSNRFRI